MTNTTTTIKNGTYSAEEKDIFAFVLKYVLNIAVKPAKTENEKKLRHDACRFFGICKTISKDITTLESDSMSARDVDLKFEAKARYNKNLKAFETYALSYGLPCSGREDFDLLEEILRNTIDYPEFGITRLIPKKRISRKTETNGIGKGKDFGKFGIKFCRQSGIIIMQA